MSSSPGEYYTEERWQNWLDRLREESIDPEDEDSARLLLNLQDDTAIAVAKILTDYAATAEGAVDEDDDSYLGEEPALAELGGMRETVLAEVDLADEDTEMLLEGVQTALMCVFYTAEEYVVSGVPENGTVPEYVDAAAEAEQDEEIDDALGYCVQAGTLIIDGADLEPDLVEDLEFGLVAEWVNGLDSLQTALEDPDVIEDDD